VSKKLIEIDFGDVELNTVALIGSWIDYGVLYGYPECCTTAFCQMMLNLLPQPPRGPWTGSGFIPCAECCKVIKAIGMRSYVRQVIAPKRQFIKPFPTDELGTPDWNCP